MLRLTAAWREKKESKGYSQVLFGMLSIVKLAPVPITVCARIAMSITLTLIQSPGPHKGSSHSGSLRANRYGTGAQYVFERYVELDAGPGRLGAAQDNAPAVTPHRFQLLLKARRRIQPWHCLMEIYILRMARNPLVGNQPFFEHPADT